MTDIKAEVPEESEALKRKLQDYEKWFRNLDSQVRVLERERRKFSAIVNHTDAGFLVFGPDEKVSWANAVFRERFGTPESKKGAEGRSCHEVVCGKSKPCKDCPAAQPFSTSKVAHSEMKLWIDNGVHYVYATGIPIESADGHIDQTIVMLQDISDLKVVGQSAEALRSSELRFRSIFERVAAGMVTTKADGSFLQVNPAFSRMVNYTDSDLTHMKLSDICLEEDLQKVEMQLDEVLAGRRHVIELEQRFRRKNGSMAWGHTTAVWQFDKDRKPSYSIALIQDITDRKHAERQLNESQQQYEALVNSVEGIVWEADPQMLKFTFVSERATQISGYTPEQWMRHTRFWRNHVHAGDIERILDGCREATENKQKIEMEYRMITVDGATIWLRDTIGVVVENDEVVKLRGVMVDVTERKLAEEALQKSEEQLRQSQKMEAVGRLAGGIAHDFNNLLTAITGYSEFLLKGLGANHPMRREANEIAKAASSAADLTGQLLAFSRQQVLKPKMLELNSVVSDMDMMLRRLIGEDIDLVTTLGEATGHVQADPGQLQQVILNLAVNARDAMHGGGLLTIQTESVDIDEAFVGNHPGIEQGSYVMLAISDTGCGMDEETRGHLFEPFYTTKDQGKGTGLGLSTVYGIVKQSGGHIYVYSEVAQGSAFKVYLPRVEHVEAAKQPEKAQPVEPRGGTETILLVEDDQAVRELTHEILEMNGYHVIQACDGLEALSICEKLEEEIHLVVTDLVMPQLGGRDLAKRLGPILPDVRVLFLSGYTDSVVMHQGLLDPGSSFLQKPFTPSGLANKVREVIEG